VRDLGDLELHRDSYLAWRERADEPHHPDRERSPQHGRGRSR
jgi:hypothetical protein